MVINLRVPSLSHKFMIAQVRERDKQYYNNQIEVSIIEPQIRTRLPWGIVEKGYYSVVVYDRQRRLKEVVERTAYPRQSFGAWAVWAVLYRGHWYTSMVDEIYPYLKVVEGNYNKKGKWMGAK